MKAHPTRERNQTLTSLLLHSDGPPDVNWPPPSSPLFLLFFYLKCYLYLLLLSSLSRNCRYNQLCKYAVVSNPPPPRFVFWFSLFVRQVVHSCFFVLNSKHLNGFWRRGSVRGRGNKEAFSWDAFTSKFLSESRCHPCGQRLSLGLKGRLGLNGPLNVPSECIKAHSEKTQ